MISALAALVLAAVNPAVPTSNVDAGAADAGVVSAEAGSVDAGAGAGAVDAGSVDAGAGAGAIDAGPPIADVAPAAPPLDFAAPTALRVYGSFRSKLLIDTNFESRPGEPLAENVAELQTHALLGATADFGERAHAVVEVKLWHRAVEQRPPAGQTFLLLNGQNAKATAEIDPGEAYLDLYSKWVDLRLGNQVLAMGANVSFAPADVLAPQDLREGVLFADDPSDVKLPVLAARARGSVWGFDWTAAYVPFFVPDRYDLYGQDEALIQPGLGASLPAENLLTLAQEDRAEQPLIETDRPKDLPQNGDVGLRLTRTLGNVTLGADYAISREKIPAITIDPELMRFAGEGASAAFTDPATAVSLSQRLASGEQLLHGTFPRFAVGEVEGSALLGPTQLDVDVGHSASRLYVTQALQPIFLPTSTAVATLSDARGTDLTLALSVLGLWIHDVPAGQSLVLLDPAGETSAHQSFDGLAALLVGDRFWNGRIELQARAYVDLRQASYAAGLRARYAVSDRVHFAVGYQRFHGAAQSLLGYFRRNDAVWGELQLDL